jgi:hypothetical protein
MQPFTHFVGIDWSGAKGMRHKGLAVAICRAGQRAPAVVKPPSGQRYWSRVECGEWLGSGCGLEQGTRVLVGVDAAFGMPFVDEGSYFPDHNLCENAPDLWREIASMCQHAEDYFGGPFIQAFSEHYQQQGGRKGQCYSWRLRLAESICRDQKIGPCESVFNLVGAAQVGKSALSTMIMLDHLSKVPNISIWPFFDSTNSAVCMVEIYAAIFSQMGGHKGKIRDGVVLNNVLKNLGSEGYAGTLPNRMDDMTDALITSAGLRRIASDGKYWNPQGLSTMVRATEGWVFGIE